MAQPEVENRRRPTLPRRSIRWSLAGLVFAWLAAIGLGLGGVEAYAARPGPRGPTPEVLPPELRVPVPGASRPLLLMALHPHCGCSRATLAELERVLAAAGPRLDATLLLFQPEGEPEDWSRSSLSRAAEAIPGVRVRPDREGRAARSLGALTSGHAVLYDARGELLFSGGITLARGHEGDNPGREALLAHLRGESSRLRETPVFGCPIQRACDCHGQGEPS
jgi:hypothetical protein